MATKPAKQPAKPQGRPPKSPMPDRIAAVPEQTAEGVLGAQPKKQ